MPAAIEAVAGAGELGRPGHGFRITHEGGYPVFSSSGVDSGWSAPTWRNPGGHRSAADPVNLGGYRASRHAASRVQCPCSVRHSSTAWLNGLMGPASGSSFFRFSKLSTLQPADPNARTRDAAW